MTIRRCHLEGECFKGQRRRSDSIFEGVKGIVNFMVLPIKGTKAFGESTKQIAMNFNKEVKKFRVNPEVYLATKWVKIIKPMMN